MKTVKQLVLVPSNIQTMQITEVVYWHARNVCKRSLKASEMKVQI